MNQTFIEASQKGTEFCEEALLRWGMTYAEELESLIRSGRFDEVEKRLYKLGKLDRKDAVVVANIARRINRLNLAAKILNPIVRSENHLQDPASSLEKIEYADILRQMGALSEAWDLLQEIDESQHPQAIAHKGYCLVNQWRYEEALVYLERYVRNEKLTSYERAVGQINLAAILIHIAHFQEAAELLTHLRKQTHESGHLLLYGNSLELSAQILVYSGDFDSALNLLAESSEVLKSAGKVVSLYVQKWRAIALSLKANKVTPELQDVFEKAHQDRHWETVRDCDLFMGHLDRDLPRLTRLYYGTPYENFRRRINRISALELPAAEFYLYSATAQPKFILDVATGHATGESAAQLPAGQALHRLLILLSQDFFKPLSVMSAFGCLFPGEYMNATTSVNRVHQIVRRCRGWIEDAGLPLAIEEIDGSYKLKLGESMGLLIPSSPLPLVKEELECLILQNRFRENRFNVHEACESLSCSPSSARTLLRWATESGRILKMGNGPSVCYRFTKDVGKTSAA